MAADARGPQCRPRGPGSRRSTCQRCPAPPALLTRALQVVAGLHGSGLLSAPLLPGLSAARATGARPRGSAGSAQPGPDSGRGGERAGEARAPRWRRLLRCSPPPCGRAGAGAGRGVAEAGPALEVSVLDWLPANPARPPGLRHALAGFCEVALTWQLFRGGRSERRWSLCCCRWPHEGGCGVCRSGRRRRLPVAPAPRRPTFRWAHPGTPDARGF